MSPVSTTSAPRILIYLLRRDLRVSDNPVLHDISRAFAATHDCNGSRSDSLGNGQRKASRPPGLPQFTHLLPIYVFPANQVEISGFMVDEGASKSPYPTARSAVGGFWRCGPHRARFLAESVYDLKEGLKNVGGDLLIRVGMAGDVLQQAFQWSEEKSGHDTQLCNGDGTARGEVVGVCMTREVGVEEKQEEDDVERVARRQGVPLHLWSDEKYFIHDDDVPYSKASELPDVFTSFRKAVEPLRSRPRRTLPAPESLPPFPEAVPPQADPFTSPESLPDLVSCLLKPLDPDLGLENPPQPIKDAVTGHPFVGGATAARGRVEHLINSSAMSNYAQTRNGLLGVDYSTKLSAFLALGCITARQVHWMIHDFEEGQGPVGSKAKGYGRGENKGTASVRFELLWRDYMRHVANKVGSKLFTINGFPKSPHQDPKSKPQWSYLESDRKFRKDQSGRRSNGSTGTDDQASVAYRLSRFLNGTTGIGLVDAAARELFLTGYVSNRARQNVASFLAKHLGIDWRLGAEWYEMLLIDYDVASNWGNWQYVAGVGNDPRQERKFNPVKQAMDYDPDGEYVKAWVPELRGVEAAKGSDDRDAALMGIFQAWRLPEHDKQRLGVKGVDWVERPLLRINFDMRQRGKPGGRGRGKGASRGGGKSGERTWRRNGNVDRIDR